MFLHCVDYRRTVMWEIEYYLLLLVSAPWEKGKNYHLLYVLEVIIPLWLRNIYWSWEGINVINFNLLLLLIFIDPTESESESKKKIWVNLKPKWNTNKFFDLQNLLNAWSIRTTFSIRTCKVIIYSSTQSSMMYWL